MERPYPEVLSTFKNSTKCSSIFIRLIEISTHLSMRVICSWWLTLLIQSSIIEKYFASLIKNESFHVWTLSWPPSLLLFCCIFSLSSYSFWWISCSFMKPSLKFSARFCFLLVINLSIAPFWDSISSSLCLFFFFFFIVFHIHMDIF